MCDLPRFCPSLLCASFSAFLSLEMKGINSAHRCSMCGKQRGVLTRRATDDCSNPALTLVSPKRLPVQVAQSWQEADRPSPRWRLRRPPGVKMAARGHACALGSPPGSLAGAGGATPVAVCRLSSTAVAVAAAPCRALCNSSAGGKSCCGCWAFRPVAWRVSAGWVGRRRLRGGDALPPAGGAGRCVAVGVLGGRGRACPGPSAG